jgi:hypothetical protein
MVAKKWKVDLDLVGNEILNGVFQNLNEAPSNPRNGQFYYDLEDNAFKLYQNDSWTSYTTPAELAAALADYVTDTELSTALEAKADASTTLAGYGITDAYTKTEVDTALGAKADSATTLAGYGITDAYTKTEVDTAIQNVDVLPAQSGNANKWLKTDGADASWANLPIATDSVLGVVKQGSNITIANDGTISSPIASVSGKTGVVTLDKSDVGLDNVDNTSDANKPISTATQAALDLKADSATTLAGYGITDAYTKTEVDSKMVAAFHYKGNVATVGALPSSGNEVGDVYNVTSTGANYAWDGENWDKLSETIDLTPFLTITDAAATYETISNVSTLSGRVTTVEGKVTALEGKALTEKQIVTQDEALIPSGDVATWTITHTLGTDVEVTIKEVATGEEIIADLTFSNNQIVVKMNVESTVAANTYKAVIVG